MNQRFLKIVCALSVCANGLLLWVSWPHLKSTSSESQKAANPLATVVTVRVTTVKQEPIAIKKVVAGTIKAIHSVSLMSDIHGKVKEIKFRQGDKVKKGQVLIQLEDAQAQAQLDEAKSHVKAAEAAYRRQKALSAKHFTTQAALDKAEADKSIALASLSKAKANLKYTTIVAPFDGEVGLCSLSVGSQVNPNQEITRIVSPSSLAVEFKVPEVINKDIYVGQEVDVLAERYDSLPVTAVIQAKEPYADPITHTTRVKAYLDSSAGSKLKDGGYASVTIPLSQDENALVVPKEALFHEHNEYYVYVIPSQEGQQKRVRACPVIVGAQDETRAQIVQGVSLGAVVVIDPVERLVDGTYVQIETST